MSVSDKQIKIINYLMKHDQPMTAKQLSIWLNISVRTVKNQIYSIQKLTEEEIITSTYQGYVINKKIASELLKQNKNKENIVQPQNYEQRVEYMNLKFLKYHVSHLNLYDFAEEIGYSEETIRQDIVKMNKTFSNMKVNYQIIGDEIRLACDENALRQLAKTVFFEDMAKGMFDIVTIKETFKNIDVDMIQMNLQNVLNQKKLYVNDFGMVNLVLHLSIVIQRLQEGQVINAGNSGSFEKDELVYSASEALCQSLQDYFSVTFTEEEKDNVYLLLKANVNVVINDDRYSIINYLGDELFEFVRDLVRELDMKYYVNLNNNNFLYPFAMHVKNLLFRLENSRKNPNPVSDMIRRSHPFVFDMAVTIGYIITDRFGFHVDKDELAYLALHIGGELERQNFSEEKIKVILVCPNYLGISSKLYNQLLMSFGNEIDLVAIINSEELLYRYDFTLVITVIPLQNDYEHVIEIPILGWNDAREMIQNKIFEIRHKMRFKILKDHFNNFFMEELFVVNEDISSAFEVMKTMADVMRSQGVVNEDYYERILERELASTTAFPNIAIPHSMKMDSIKTCVGVMICPKGIRWGGHNVKLVLTIAINKIDAYMFSELYQALIELFDNEDHLEKIMKVSSFSDFESTVKDMI